MLSKEKLKKWHNNELMVDREEQWLEHIKGYKFKWPRWVGFPWQKSGISSESEFVDIIDEYVDSNNAYTSVYSKNQISDEVFHTFYVDIDAELEGIDKLEGELQKLKFDKKISEAFEEVKRFVCHMEDKYNATPRVYFSGGGFSIYTDFDTIKVAHGAVVTTIRTELKNANVDERIIDGCVFEPRRISRLPYSLNWKNLNERNLGLMMCIPVDPHWNSDTMLREIKTLTIQKEVEIDKSQLLSKEIKQRDEKGDFKSVSSSFDDEDVQVNPENGLKRAKKVMDAAKHLNDGRHRTLHFILVPSLVEAGFEENQIHDFCKKFVHKTGESYSGTKYEEYVDESINRTVEGPSGANHQWKAWSFNRFLKENPELLRHYDT